MFQASICNFCVCIDVCFEVCVNECNDPAGASSAGGRGAVWVGALRLKLGSVPSLCISTTFILWVCIVLFIANVTGLIL